ncbi:hypothetical protein [uncultured Propionivibrio sp.]|uniref:hypothetical protein n=1 Tax=uncultured Propionivibrio sp. TaxID=426737 RepID=UPI0029BFB4B6|nr:hypothetical protein [uncultured Propionivibrio sp.]
MICLRKITSLAFAALTALLVLGAFVVVFSDRGVSKTIQHSHEIEYLFSLASAFVEGFEKTNGHLPSQSEFRAWADTLPDMAYSAKGMYLLTSQSQFPDEVIKRFGPSPQDGYIIELWRGEWFEYFSSWAKASTLEFDATKFYFSGSAVIDGLAILALGVAIGYISRFLWPRSTRHSSGTL